MIADVQRPRIAKRRSDGDVLDRLLAERENGEDDVARDFFVLAVEEMQSFDSANDGLDVLSSGTGDEDVVEIDVQSLQAAPRDA